jgi:hypothetical protein
MAALRCNRGREMNAFPIIFALAFVGLFGTGLIYSITYDKMRSEAVKHHAAEYYLDSNNNRQWRWLDEPKKGETK